MKTPGNKTPDNGIDFEVVPIKVAAQVKSPAELDDKFKASPEEKNTSKPVEDIATIKKLTESLEAKPVVSDAKPQAKVEKPQEASPSSERDLAFNELLKDYPSMSNKEFTRGQAEDMIDNSNDKNHFSGMEKFALPATAVGMGVVAANAAAIPAFVSSLALGSTGAMTGAGIAAATAFGVIPIVAGAGIVAYGGYKLYKNIRGRLKIRSDRKKLEAAWGK